MKDLDEIALRLQQAGLHAKFREWELGATVAVSLKPEVLSNGIHLLNRIYYVLQVESEWIVVDCRAGGSEIEVLSKANTISDVVDSVIALFN